MESIPTLQLVRPTSCGQRSGKILQLKGGVGVLMADMSAEASAKTLWMGEARDAKSNHCVRVLGRHARVQQSCSMDCIYTKRVFKE